MWAMDGLDIRVLTQVRVYAERPRNAADVSWLHTGLAQIYFGRILIFCEVSGSKGRTVRDACLLACRSSQHKVQEDLHHAAASGRPPRPLRANNT